MSKKNKKEMKPRNPARFAAGAQVRVKPGTSDPDFPDIPLGGWAGTVREVDERSAPPTYLVEWNRHTLDHMHTLYRKRCERDGLELASMWLGEDDIEADSGRPAVIEQPTSIVTRPLNEKDQDDRVRIALGLTSNDPLSEVDDDTLRAYHRYLAAHLAFPFEAKWEPEHGPAHTIKITGLGDPEDDAWADEMYGLLCEARAEGRLTEVPLAECEAKKGNPNRHLLKDYSYWFWNNRSEGVRRCAAWFAAWSVGGFSGEYTNGSQLQAWLHDVVYDSRASDNEERSAEYAERLCQNLSIPERRLVASLILKTKTHDAGGDADAEVLLDADLAILGASEAVYRIYGANIRKEYAWVPEPQYWQGRRRVLESFLSRPRIFHLLTHLEEPARHNLAAEIAQLADA